MKIDLKKLKEQKQENTQERLEFVQFWAEYVKNHSDEEWSAQQNVVIDSQFV